jgi:hypothetical protein
MISVDIYDYLPAAGLMAASAEMPEAGSFKSSSFLPTFFMKAFCSALMVESILTVALIGLVSETYDRC